MSIFFFLHKIHFCTPCKNRPHKSKQRRAKGKSARLPLDSGVYCIWISTN